MIAKILMEAGHDPTVMVGGDYPFLEGGNARVGASAWVVVEACEAYGGLDFLCPEVAVITNIEPDHLDHNRTWEGLLHQFQGFAERSRNPFVGGDTPLGMGRVGTWDAPSLPHAPGEHNRQNAQAAATVAESIGISQAHVVAGLESFSLPGRRFEVLGETASGITVIDDYAHHPTEIRATFQAARVAYPNRRIVALYQPHLPSRTRDFLDDFADALTPSEMGADLVYLTDIYLAREMEQPGLIELLAEKSGATLVKDRFALPERTATDLKRGDVALFMGAGNIREQAEAFLQLNTT
jgi:UDP-N-acetylmuramate--alanine ligase